MYAGDLNQKITIQRATTSKNSLGESVKTYATHLTRAANVRFLTTREYLIGQSQINTEITAEIWLRSPVDVVATDRIIYETRTYEISGSPIPVSKYWTKLLVKEQNA